MTSQPSLADYLIAVMVTYVMHFIKMTLVLMGLYFCCCPHPVLFCFPPSSSVCYSGSCATSLAVTWNWPLK